jgi:hypothetical protein
MKPILSSVIGVYLTAAAIALAPPAQAQSFPVAPKGCVYLREITTGRPFIRKVIERNNSNANTDFAVPTGTRWVTYVGRMIPENNATYKAEVNLKYNDNSTAQAVNRTIQARRFYRYDQPFRTPTERQPFQINGRVTGDRNTAYQIAVLACPDGVAP